MSTCKGNKTLPVFEGDQKITYIRGLGHHYIVENDTVYFLPCKINITGKRVFNGTWISASQLRTVNFGGNSGKTIVVEWKVYFLYLIFKFTENISTPKITIEYSQHLMYLFGKFYISYL